MYQIILICQAIFINVYLKESFLFRLESEITAQSAVIRELTESINFIHTVLFLLLGNANANRTVEYKRES